MKNHLFEIQFDKTCGAVTSIVHPVDSHGMNWCAADSPWGIPHSIHRDEVWGLHHWRDRDLTLTFFQQSETEAVSVYCNEMLEVTVNRFFRANGNFVERFTIKNVQDYDVFIGQDNFGIVVPVNDRYPDAATCMTQHCNAHIWCGHSSSYINALRMGISDCNLGLVLTEGSLASYSQDSIQGDDRGIFILNSDFFTLVGGDSYVIEWELFWHTGKEDFHNQLSNYPHFIRVTSPNFTVYQGEGICFTADGAAVSEDVRIICDETVVPYTLENGTLTVSYMPTRLGEHCFDIYAGDIHTYTEFFVSEPLETVIEKRLQFIVDKQQYHNPRSHLDGAFLIYDNQDKHLVFDDAIGDHNACHERMGMAILLAKYLQTHENPQFMEALKLYDRFLRREFYNEQTGQVYTDIGKRATRIRLYNPPWVMMFFSEMYLLTRDPYYPNEIVRLVDFYYDNGGKKFYPNGVSFIRIMEALNMAQHPQCQRVMDLFRDHMESYLAIGTDYPKHEVSYEQTIVTPAVTLLSQICALTGEVKYLEAVRSHVQTLERFNGNQPSFHLNEIPIRYWDDFWFGKRRLYGDTFPHYWSCLTARSYLEYCAISGEEAYRTDAGKCFRNCLCLFNDRGEGSCAYVYPRKVNGQPGQFYDEWANDQDFALYFAICAETADT